MTTETTFWDEGRMDYQLPDGYVERAPRMEDTEALVEMFNAASRKLLGIEPHDLEEQRSEFETPGRSLEDDFRVVVAADGKMAGYYEVYGLIEPFTPLYCWGRVHPEHTGRGVGSFLLRWAEERARKALPLSRPEIQVSLWAFSHTIDAAAQELFVNQGFKLLRHSLRMVIELDQEPPEPVWPEGITVRTLVPGRDEYAAFLAGREAFQDHWGHVERPIEEEYEQWKHRRLEDSEYDPSLWFLALDGDEIAGNSMNLRSVDNNPEIGWVGSLSVRRPWRKQGLGLALLLQSFGEYYHRGYHKVALGVDAENLSGAVGLYEKAGMHSDPQHQMTIYEKELRAGIDISVKG